MGSFFKLDPRRLRRDSQVLIGDSREYCMVYRRAVGADAEAQVGQFWARLSNADRQTTRLEQTLAGGNVTGTLWILRVSLGAIPLRHDDEIRTDGVNDARWRVVHVRPLVDGQLCILSHIE